MSNRFSWCKRCKYQMMQVGFIHHNLFLEFFVVMLLALCIFSSDPVFAIPFVNDTNLTVETVVEGINSLTGVSSLYSPTGMSFLNNESFLVLEREGRVRLVSEGKVLQEPVLNVTTSTNGEQGLLAIAGPHGLNGTLEDIFLYYTDPGEGEIKNKIYKYEWDGSALTNPRLILELPATSTPAIHNGGKLVIGKDGYLYGVIGDLFVRKGLVQNEVSGLEADNTSAIFRVFPNNGSSAPDNPWSSDPNNPLSRYYAYGIRNSFGITFDPVNGNIWDTENGFTTFDEINLVKPGFNSGWYKIMGPIHSSSYNASDLVEFEGSYYSDPILSWRTPVGITDIEFFNSSMLGEKYKNNLFVGDINNGNLYYFILDSNRSGFVLNNTFLKDRIIDNDEELDAITFGSGFGGITDLLTGPDGLLYIVSYDEGAIYRIRPIDQVQIQD